MCAHWYNAGDASGVGLGGACRRRVHDRVLCGTEEIGGATETIEHSGSHDAGAVGMGVDVHFDGGIHSDDTEAADDLRGVGNLLGAKE